MQGSFIVSSSTGILEALEGLGKGKEEGRGVTCLSFGSMSEAVEPLSLGQREGLAHPRSGDRGPGNEAFTLLDGEVQDHGTGLGIDTQENRSPPVKPKRRMWVTHTASGPEEIRGCLRIRFLLRKNQVATGRAPSSTSPASSVLIPRLSSNIPVDI